jgi:MFS family permease
VSAGWISGLFVAQLGMWLATYAPLQVLLPNQVEVFGAAHKNLWLSITMGAGAIAALIANPVIGAVSDRTTSAWGRRHPWTLISTVIAAVGLGILAEANSELTVVAGWAVTQIGLNGVLAMLTAALPDRVPVAQRAQLGGFIGISQMLGTVLGALLVTEFFTSQASGYVSCLALLGVGSALFVVLTEDQQLLTKPEKAFQFKDMLSALKDKTFARAWTMHLFINLGNAIGTLYLLYFLKDKVHYADPNTGLLILMALYGGVLMVAAIVVGIMSDRSNRRVPYVQFSAIVMALAAVMLVVWPTWSSALLAAPLLGVGFGAYWAVAMAVLTEVLPDVTARAKDVGVINIATALPQVLGPLVCAVCLAVLGGYAALFAASAIATALGGFLSGKLAR